MTTTRALLISAFLFYGGFIVLLWKLGFLPALAVYAMIVAHNLEYHKPKP